MTCEAAVAIVVGLPRRKLVRLDHDLKQIPRSLSRVSVPAIAAWLADDWGGRVVPFSLVRSLRFVFPAAPSMREIRIAIGCGGNDDPTTE
jgi:hypothetical protein